MTTAPCAVAYFSIDLPTPESSGSMISTLSPLVMSAWARLSWVASLPWAFCTENCELDRPAVSSAFVRYGASNSVYRAEVVVSGRITPTPPLPCAASGLSLAIAEKSFVKSVAEIDGTRRGAA